MAATSRDGEVDAGWTENGEPVADRAESETESVQVPEADRQPQQVLQVEQPGDGHSKQHLCEQRDRRHGAGDQAEEVPSQGVALDGEDRRKQPQSQDSRKREEQDGHEDRDRQRLLAPPDRVRQGQPRERQQEIGPATRVRERRHRVLGCRSSRL